MGFLHTISKPYRVAYVRWWNHLSIKKLDICIPSSWAIHFDYEI